MDADYRLHYTKYRRQSVTLFPGADEQSVLGRLIVLAK